MAIRNLTAAMWWLPMRTVLVLAAIVWGTASQKPYPGLSGQRLATLVLLVLATAGGLLWTWQRSTRRSTTTAVLLTLVGGLALTIIHPTGASAAFPGIACLWAGYRLPRRYAFAMTAAACLLYPLAGFATGFGWYLVAAPAGFSMGLMGGLIRRQREELAEETRLAQEEQTRSAALSERGRIAREIHDVLAHSLAALTVQLETADALLERGRTEQARQSVLRAGQLAREGLAETRRAIGALRGETLPLPDLLDTLAAGYRADFQAPATVRVDGSPTALSADTSLALYRSAQEAMTNIRKHAPGAPVRLDLRYAPGIVNLCVENGSPPPGVPRPLSGAGGGYGLTGLRERAALAGGTFDAGPAGDGYRVDVRIPV